MDRIDSVLAARWMERLGDWRTVSALLRLALSDHKPSQEILEAAAGARLGSFVVENGKPQDRYSPSVECLPGTDQEIPRLIGAAMEIAPGIGWNGVHILTRPGVFPETLRTGLDGHPAGDLIDHADIPADATLRTPGGGRPPAAFIRVDGVPSVELGRPHLFDMLRISTSTSLRAAVAGWRDAERETDLRYVRHHVEKSTYAMVALCSLINLETYSLEARFIVPYPFLMAKGRIKGREIPEGHVARGCTGRAVNVGVFLDRCYRSEVARQRWIWNHFLAIQIETYQFVGEFVFYHEMARRLTLLRKVNTWIGDGGVAAQQTTLRDLEKALKDSFPSAKNRKGFPKFRKAEDRRDRMSVPAKDLNVVRLGDGTVTHLKFPNQPPIRVRNLHVPIGGRITKGSISMDGQGWRVSLGIVAPPPKVPEPTVASLGVDVGLKHLVVTSDGEFIENPTPLKKALKRLRRASRTMSRRTKGSVGRKRAARAVGRIHRRVADIRRGNHHRVTRGIVNRTAHLSVETIRAKALMQGWNPRASADAALGELLRQLEYKAKWAARSFHKLDPFERSTGCCPDCDRIGPRLDLSVRTWMCGECGVEHDRDLAAARWIDKVGRRSPEPVKAQAPQSPKRGNLPERSGATAKAAPRRSGPPANVPGHAAPTARVSAG